MVDVQQDTTFSEVKTVNENQKVRYSSQVEIDSHLFKLVEAPVIKYIGKGTDKDKYPADTPEDFLNMGHAHVFRTADTDGNKHTKSVPIAGHYHLVKLKVDPKNPDQAPEIIGMSGPMHQVTKRVKGRMVTVDAPLNEYDHHTHDVEYIKSEKIQARVNNKDAVNFLSKEASKVPAAPTGLGAPGSR